MPKKIPIKRQCYFPEHTGNRNLVSRQIFFANTLFNMIYMFNHTKYSEQLLNKWFFFVVSIIFLCLKNKILICDVILCYFLKSLSHNNTSYFHNLTNYVTKHSEQVLNKWFFFVVFNQFFVFNKSLSHHNFTIWLIMQISQNSKEERFQLILAGLGLWGSKKSKYQSKFMILIFKVQ